jgi:DNA-binding CsgD family transcriptional regulator
VFGEVCFVYFWGKRSKVVSGFFVLNVICIQIDSQKGVKEMKGARNVPLSEHLQDDEVKDLVAGLTEKQLKVLKLYADGLRTKEIAALLNISIKTVQTHIQRVQELTMVNGQNELTKVALRAGLTDLVLRREREAGEAIMLTSQC